MKSMKFVHVIKHSYTEIFIAVLYNTIMQGYNNAGI